MNATFVGTNYLPTLAPTVVNGLDTAQIRRDLARAVLFEPDFVIAVVHWGLEHRLEENPAQRWQAEFLAKNGVGAVVGMHPHVAQPVRTLVFETEKGEKNATLVAYSLGNFVSNHRLPNADGGLLLRLELVRKNGEKAAISRQGWLPVWRLIAEKGEGKKAAFFVLPISEIERDAAFCPELDEKNRRAALDFAAKLRERLGAAGEWRGGF